MATRKKVRSKEKLHPTSVDYIIVALVPALIIGMICGLTYFLIFAFYQGNFSSRLMYLFSLFVLAAVLIARISAEEGRGYASLFAIPLGLASLLTINTFARVEGPLASISWLINAGLLALIWFLADRITLDCTVIDERSQDSQQGLLQSLGMLRKEEALVSKPTVRSTQKEEPKKKKKAHNPGVWVMYFALFALPMFGIGQLVLPESTTAAFICLIVYLGCALSLLAATSFLSMRRYVRQKGVEMPVDVTTKWLPLSVSAIFAILLVALILPLPGRSLGLVGSPIKFSSGELDTSQFGWGDEGNGQDDNEAASKTQSDEGTPDGPAKKDGKGNPQPADKGNKTSQQSGGSEKRDQQNGQQSGRGGDSEAQRESESTSNSEQESQHDASKEQRAASEEQQDSDQSQNEVDPTQGEDKQSDSPKDQRRSPDKSGNQSGGKQQERENQGSPENDSEQRSSQPSSASPPQPSFIPKISGNFSEVLKWITMLVLAAIVLFYLITHPQEVRAMWAAFRNWLANLLGKKKPKKRSAAPARIAPQPQKKPFRDYINPFTSGQPFSAEKIITHTYQALQAWAEEHGTIIDDDTTPSELADQLLQVNPSVGTNSKVLAQMVNRLLFARWSPTVKDIAPLKQLWQNMSAS